MTATATLDPSPTAPPPDDEPPRLNPGQRIAYAAVRIVKENTIALVIGAGLLILVGGPLYYLIRMSLGLGNPVRPGPLTLANYRAVFTDGRTYDSLLSTVLYSVGVTVISLVLAIAAAWLIERTDLPGRNLAWIAMLAPIAIPGVLSSMAWILLAAPQTGAINVALREVMSWFGSGIERGPINIYSLPGMIFVEGLRGATTLFLMIVGAFRLMDPSLEDASSLSGASRWQTLRRVTLPLLVPAILAATVYSFLGNLQDFDTPLLLGLPAGIYILPTLIYFVAYVSPIPNWGLASAYASLFLIVLAVLAVLYYRVVIKRSRRFQTIVGKAYRPQRIRLGRWRYVASAGFALFFLLSLGLPLLILLWASLLPGYEPPSLAALQNLTAENYARLIDDPGMVRAFWNSAKLGIGTATAGMLVAFVVSWAIVRLKVRGGLLLDGLAFLPNAIPTVSIGLGFIVLYLSPLANWTHLYGTLTLLILALVVNYLAFSTRLANGAMAQLGQELEEQSWVAGHNKLATLARVTGPLLLPTFVAGWVWIFAHSVRQLTIPLLMGTNRNEVVAQRLYQTWSQQGDLPYASAIAVVLLVVLLVFALGARRLITRGFTNE